MSTLEEDRRRAAAVHRQGNFDEAAEKYLSILEANPRDFETLFLLGLLKGQRSEFDQSTEFFSRALDVDKNHVIARINLGRAHRGAGRIDDAIAEFDKVLALYPSHVEALFAKGSTLLEGGRLPAAIECYDQLLAVQPKHASAWLNRGNAHWEMRSIEAAFLSYQKARESDPTIADHHLSEGQALLALNRDQQAREAFDRAVQLDPNLVEAHLGRASALMKQRNIVGALVSADRARQLQPNSARAYCLIGCGQLELGHFDQSLKFLNVALELEPNYPEAQFAKGEVLQHLGRYAEAATAFAGVIDAKPSMHMAFGNLLHNRMRNCDWRDFDSLSSKISEMIDAGSLAISPFALQAFCDDPSTLETCARNTTRRFHPRGARSFSRSRLRNQGKIRVGILCGDFGESLLAAALEPVWRNHDDSRFELVAIDSGFDDLSERRKRLRAIFPQWVVVTDLSDVDSALRIAALQLDVLIDLNGFQGKGRPGILALRPVGVQARFLGFPGTCGADYVDYFITDEYSLPPEAAAHFAEQPIYLPGCAQAAPELRAIAGAVTRRALSLPEHGTLLATNADGFRITPSMFKTWLEILQRVPNSYLWVLKSSTDLESRLRAESDSSGISAERVLFTAPSESIESLSTHLSLADLLLDVSPFSDPGTAGLALAAGVPVVALTGKTMGSRLTASLLRSIQLESLIVDNLHDYAEKVSELALSHPMRESVKAEIIRGATESAAFKHIKLARALEKAFVYMVERAEHALPPASIKIQGQF